MMTVNVAPLPALPELPTLPLSVLVLFSLFTIAGVALTILLYFTLFPPSIKLSCYKWSMRLVDICGQRTRHKDNGRYRNISTRTDSDSDDVYELEAYFTVDHNNATSDECSQSGNLSGVSVTSIAFSEEDQRHEFDWLLHRGQFDESQAVWPSPTTVVRRRSRSSPPKPVDAAFATSMRRIATPLISTFRSVPSTPNLGLSGSRNRRCSNECEDALSGRYNTNRNGNGDGGRTSSPNSSSSCVDSKGFWERLDSTVEWAAGEVIRYTFDNNGLRVELLFPGTKVEKEAAEK